MRVVNERVVQSGAGRFRSGSGGADVKGYLERVAKYVPAEIVAAYTTADGFASLAKFQGALYIAIFVVCLIGTPIYITRFTSTRKEHWVNGIMATLAFVVWAYATGSGLPKYLGWYDASTASVVMVLFTVVSGWVVPVSKQAPVAPQVQESASPPSSSA